MKTAQFCCSEIVFNSFLTAKRNSIDKFSSLVALNKFCKSVSLSFSRDHHSELFFGEVGSLLQNCQF